MKKILIYISLIFLLSCSIINKEHKKFDKYEYMDKAREYIYNKYNVNILRDDIEFRRLINGWEFKLYDINRNYVIMFDLDGNIVKEK